MKSPLLLAARIAFVALTALTLPATPAVAQQFWSQAAGSPTDAGRHDDLFFIDETTGWAIKNPRIYKSTDGGEAWAEKRHQPGTHFRCIGFASETRGWAGNLGVGSYDGNVTDPHVLYETFDGGESWSVVPGIDESGIKGLCALQVLDENTVFGAGRVRGPAFFIKSTDGGDTWTVKNLTEAGVMNAIMDVYFHDPLNGFAVGMDDNPYAANCATPYFGRIARTTDGGETWTPVLTTEVACSYFWKMSWPSPEVGYVSLQQNGPYNAVVFYKTVDGGATWSHHEIPLSDIGASSFYLQGIGFVDEDEGWIGGNSNTPPRNFLHTADGGETWTPAGYADTALINKIRFVNPLLGFAAGRRLHIYRSPLAITAHPESLSIHEGGQATLTVAAIGDAAISYQWQKEGVNLDGETNPTLTLHAIDDSAAGSYRALVSNAGRSLTSRAADVTVAPIEPIPFEIWAEALPSGERGAEDDPGGHGISNLLRYAFGLSPLQPERERLPAPSLQSIDHGNGPQPHLALTFTRSKQTVNLAWTAETSADLAQWTPFSFTETAVDDGNGQTETVTITDSEPLAAHPKRFLRVRVE